MEPKWLSWAKKLQSIAQAGLTYSKDKYDIERFQQIRDLSAEILPCLQKELRENKLPCALKQRITIIF
jgi:hypothetical protein